MARKPRGFFKASPWELEDAEEESVEIVVNRSPKAFVIEDGRLTGMTFDGMEYDLDATAASPPSASTGEDSCPPTTSSSPSARRTPSPGSSATSASSSTSGTCRSSTRTTFQSTRPGVFFGGDAAFGPEEHHLGGGARPPGRHLHPQHCQGEPVTERLPPGMNLQSRKMGMHEWSYPTTTTRPSGGRCRTSSLKERFKKLNIEVELGFTAEQTAREVQRCLNCDVQTVFTAKLCIECDACIDICPVDCLTITPNGDGGGAAHAPQGAGAQPRPSRCTCPAPLPQTGRVMVKDEDLCVHCGLCAERCPTAAWDMQKSDAALAARRRRSRRARCAQDPRSPEAYAPSAVLHASTTSPSRSPRSTAPARRAPTRC